MTYGTTNHNTSAVNASVTDVAITNAIAVAISVSTRTKSWSVSAGFNVHVNWVHAHQISQNSSTERATPLHDRCVAVSAVTCVTAKTNTKSKNSSTKVTA